MKKISTILLAWLASNLCYAQNSGVQFVRDMTWPQIKAKAKAENKYIFMDCYATWCGPCKKMDEKVFSDKKVADFYNPRFISVRVQLDQTANDASDIKAWYGEAKSIGSEHAVKILPTFLFFNPDGQRVYRMEGAQDVFQTIFMADRALKAEKEFWPLVAAYQAGKLPIVQYPDLEAKAKAANNWALANELSLLYKEKYIDQLSEKQLLNEGNILYLVTHTQLIQEKDMIFQLAKSSPGKIDSVQKGMAKMIFLEVIRQRYIRDKAYVNGQPAEKAPDWLAMERAIMKKFGKTYVQLLVPFEKIQYYKEKGHYSAFADAVEEDLQLHPLQKGDDNAAGTLNNRAWFGIFFNSDDPELIKRAIHWMDLVIEAMPGDEGYLDTKANLLYKLGETHEAIRLEESIIAAIVKRKNKPAEEVAKGYLEVVTKMRKGQATWTDQ